MLCLIHSLLSGLALADDVSRETCRTVHAHAEMPEVRYRVILLQRELAGAAAKEL